MTPTARVLACLLLVLPLCGVSTAQPDAQHELSTDRVDLIARLLALQGIGVQRSLCQRRRPAHASH